MKNVTMNSGFGVFYAVLISTQFLERSIDKKTSKVRSRDLRINHLGLGAIWLFLFLKDKGIWE